MIIQCEQCRTKYRLDDSRVSERGVKVRCAKCRNVFTVAKDQPEAAESSAFAAALDHAEDLTHEQLSAHSDQESEQTDDSLSFSDDQAPATPPTEEPKSELGSDTATFTNQLFDTIPPQQVEAAEPEFDISSFDTTDFEANTETELPPPLPDTVETAATDDLTLSSLEADAGLTPEHTETGTPPEFDFGNFDFGAPPADADKTVVSSAPYDAGDMTMLQPPPVPSAEPADTESHLDGFADALSSADMAPQSESVTEAPAADAFSLDELDFTADLHAPAVTHQVNPDQLDAGHDLLFVPLDADQHKEEESARIITWNEPSPAPAQPAQQEEAELTPIKFGIFYPWTLETDSSDADEEAPGEDGASPLSITSRRKQASQNRAFLIIMALASVFALFYFGYQKDAAEKAQMAAPDEGGKVTLRAVDASYVKNKVTQSELLVITGEAINNYDTPRAALRVKGMVYDAENQVLATKFAYCGNPLTKEQLATMQPNQIEAAMANQFGDTLANIDVPPGKAIPFVIVITRIPESAKDYGVEQAGSTPIAGKQ